MGTWGTFDGVVVVGFGDAGYDMRNGAWSAEGGWPTGIVVENSCFDGNGADWPTDSGCDQDPPTSDCNDPKNDSAPAMTADYFEEDLLLAEEARNNFSDEDPMLGDVSGACTGAMDPDYSLENANCMGAFGGPDGTDWTDGWTAFPAGSFDTMNCP